jgi:hypothetical protein
VRSPISLGILFVFMGAFSLAGTPGGMAGLSTLRPGAFVLAGILTVTGLLIMTRMRVAYYLGLLAGGATAISGVVAWGWPAIAARSSLTLHPAIATVVGLYLVMRVAIAHTMFGKQPELPRA